MSVTFKTPSRDPLGNSKKPQKAKLASKLCKIYEPKNPNKALKDPQSKPENENSSKYQEPTYNTHLEYDTQYKKDYNYGHDYGKITTTPGSNQKAGRGRNNGSGKKAGGYTRPQWVKQIVPKEKTVKSEQVIQPDKTNTDDLFSFTTPQKEKSIIRSEATEGKLSQTISALSNMSGGASTEATLESRMSLGSVDILDGVDHISLKGKGQTIRQFASTLLEVGKQDGVESDDISFKRNDLFSKSEKKIRNTYEKSRSAETFTLAELEVCKEVGQGPNLSEETDESDGDEQNHRRSPKARPLPISEVFDDFGEESKKGQDFSKSVPRAAHEILATRKQSQSQPFDTTDRIDQLELDTLQKIKSFEHIPDALSDDQPEDLPVTPKPIQQENDITEAKNENGPWIEQSIRLLHFPSQQLGEIRMNLEPMRTNLHYVPQGPVQPQNFPHFSHQPDSFDHNNHFSSFPPHSTHSQISTTTHQPEPFSSVGLKYIFNQLVPEYYDINIWFYLDRDQALQGPFSGRSMDQWYVNGFLPLDLRITIGKQTGFRTIHELVEVTRKMVANDNTTHHMANNDHNDFRNELSRAQGHHYNYPNSSHNFHPISHSHQSPSYFVQGNMTESKGLLDFNQAGNHANTYFEAPRTTNLQNGMNTPMLYDIPDNTNSMNYASTKLKVSDLYDDHEEFKNLEADIYNFNNSNMENQRRNEGIPLATQVQMGFMNPMHNTKNTATSSSQPLLHLRTENQFVSQRPVPQENFSKSPKNQPFEVAKLSQFQDFAWKALHLDDE